MNQSPDVQLQVSLRALNDIVIPILVQADADKHAIEIAARTLRDQVTAFYSRSADTPLAGELERLILTISGDHVDQCRQWCAPFGFEASPEALPEPVW